MVVAAGSQSLVPRPSGVPAFMIMGTARSGTTLVQRLASELSGVSVPPETGFFPFFALGLVRRHVFPMDPVSLRAELATWTKLADNLALVGKSLDDVMDLVGERCDRPSTLFAAVVRTLGGPADLYGEKTPASLLWLPVVARDMPYLRFVGVVRDPRAVAASLMPMPFGGNSAPAVADGWRRDQRMLAWGQATLGERMLVMRYEDIVARPHETRDAIAAHLGLRAHSVATIDRPLFLTRETWKANAVGPITTERVATWRSSLSDRQARQVIAICRSGMDHFGYETLPRRATWREYATLSPREQLRRATWWPIRVRLERRIARSAV